MCQNQIDCDGNGPSNFCSSGARQAKFPTTENVMDVVVKDGWGKLGAAILALLVFGVVSTFQQPTFGQDSTGGTSETPGAKTTGTGSEESAPDGVRALEPLTPNDQEIRIDSENPDLPVPGTTRKRSNALRKTLQKQAATEDQTGVTTDSPDSVDLGVSQPMDGQSTAESTSVIVEPTAGGKSKKELIPTDPVGLFFAGGHVMPVILLASIVTLWFGLERLFVLRRGRVIPRAFVNRFLQHLEEGKLTPETALRLCEENKSPMADVFAHGVRKWGKTSVEVEQAIIDGGERQIAQLRTNLRVINGMANIAPMLGLLGTVFGMILSFNELAQGSETNRSERLANGIGHALISTAAGLAVAIISIVLYMYLSGKIDRLVIAMDELSQKVVNLISGEALASRPRNIPVKPMTPVTPTSPTVAPATGKPKPVGT